jgi:dephospho-CoA kinase
MTRPRLIGITGGIATGKSTVLSILTAKGAEIIDADQVYHQLIAPGGSLVQVLATRFGEGVLADDGSIDRRQLREIVFTDPIALAQLDRITHPAVATAIRSQVASSKAAVVVIDAVKLVESGLADECDAIWLVLASPAVQLERLMERNGISEGDAHQRILAQPTFAQARAMANEIIDNSWSREDLQRKVENAWSRFEARPSPST